MPALFFDAAWIERKSMNYCEWVNTMPPETDDPNKHYHDCCYGFNIDQDNELFERLVLEINQAGLSLESDFKETNRISDGLLWV